MARDHRAGGQVEPHAARMGELLPSRHRHQGVPGDRQLHRGAVTPVVAHQAQGQAKQGRDLSTLAPLRALRARTPDRARARYAVGEGVRSCPRAGCGSAACPVRRAGCGNGVTAEPLRHRQTKEAANGYVQPTTTAPHLDSTKMRRTRIEHMLSALPPLATEERTFGIGSFVPKPAVSRCSNMPCAEGRVIPAAGTSDYCGSLCFGRRLLRRPSGFIPFYLLFERVVFAKPVSTFAGDAS